MLNTVLLIVLSAALITILYAFFIFYKVGKIKIKNKKVEDVSSYIRNGAKTFLKREYKIIIIFVIALAIVLACLGLIPALKGKAEGVGWQSSICFVVGALFSATTGVVGMLIATKANARTADIVDEKGISGALKVAFSGGAVLGLSVVGFGLFGLTGLFFIFKGFTNPTEAEALKEAASIVNGYGLGCSMIALFARVGGGIYTKAADVGADIVGKIENDIPEDDPRNPATIADNVGDNVGDIAGMGSDLCESYVGSIISCIALGSTLITGNNITALLFPLLIAASGLIASIISTIIIRSREWKNPQLTLSIATYIATGVVLVATVLLSIFFLKDAAGNPMPKAIGAVVAGLVCGIAVGKIAEIYTSADYKSVKEIAKESETGHATNIIAGLGIGLKSTFLTIVALVAGIVVAYMFLGTYGIALAAVGMLSTAGITISVDGYGPVADNAGGIAEMSGLDESVREVTDKLDSVGNTTAAIGKGFCIGSATFTALALFFSYANAAHLVDEAGNLSINLLDTPVIVGLLIGAMLPFLFSALVIASVGKAGNKMVVEVRRQFAENPEILKGNALPDYNKCIDISTKASLREMILPGIIAVATPILIGFLLGREALGGLLAGGLVSAIMLAVFMANSGGAWDNAKKYIESGKNGGKHSLAHQASITGDTVGDPLKDTAGPAMDILIKLMSIISLIIAPILVNSSSLWEFLMTIINK